MPGGKRKLAQLFTSRTKTGANGTWLTKVMSGSVGFAVVGAAMDAADSNACTIVEVTISNLSSCAMMFGNVTGLSACLRDGPQLIAGDGQASIVLRMNASPYSGSMDGRASGAVLRWVAFDPA